MSEMGKSDTGSLGSAVDSESRQAMQHDDSEDQPNMGVEGGLFGVLFTVSKEKAPGKAFVTFRLLLDWVQVFLLIVNPYYGWDIDPTNKAWQIFSWISLNQFMSSRGYTFFLACMYVLAVALAANLALCVWVSNSFKTNNFEHVWPIAVLRVFSLVFYQVLDIASLTLFLMTMDCQYFSVPEENLGRHAEFSEIMCWTMPHMIHVAVAAIAIAIFWVLAMLFTMAEIELNPVSKNPIGMAHTKAEVCAFAVKMVMTCVSVFINGPKWMSILQLIGSGTLVYLYLAWLPYLHATVNHIRVGSYMSVLWAAILLVFMSLQLGLDQDDEEAVNKLQSQLTTALWAGLVPAAAIGAALSYWRTHYYTVVVVNKFRDAPLDMKPSHIHEFTDARQVELASRCCRVWVGRDLLDEDSVQVAERIVRAGMSMLHDPYMAIWWSSFLIDVRGSYQSGYVALQAAKKMPNPSFLERFCIFVREQEHTQKASAASSGENASADLVSYVEFQRNYRLVLRLHSEALNAKRTFWETLLHSSVSFDALAKAVARVDQTVRESERMYKQVLSRHSSSVKLLSLYVKFLKFVKNDPWSAARWSGEADKLQKAEEEQNERAVLGEGEGDKRKIQGFDESKGIVIMCANCLIRMVNESAAQMFGYSQKAELVGKNLNVLVPPPFSHNHNNYVRTYIETGHSRMLDSQCEVVAMHKDRFVIPVKMFVTKVSGIGEDSVFMGVFQQLPAEANTAQVWLMASGQVLSCDGVFTDWMGYKQEDIHMKPMRDLVVRQLEMDEVLAQVKQGTAVPRIPTHMRRRSSIVDPANLHNLTSNGDVITSPKGDPDYCAWNNKPAFGSTTSSLPPNLWALPRGMQLRHSFMDSSVEVEGTLQVSGLVDVPIIVMKLTRVGDQTSDFVMVTDDKGRIGHVSSQLANRLGTTASKLQGSGMMHALDALLPAPFVRLHYQWARPNPKAVPPPWSCRSNLSVCLNATGPSGPCVVPFSLEMKTKDVSVRERSTIVRLIERTPQQMLDERRMSLMINSKGMVTSAGASPFSLFDMDPESLVGCPLAHILDILRPPMDLALNNDITGMLDHEEDAVRTLMTMAQRSYDNPGMSWRVGVSAILDPIALAALGPMGQAMVAKETVPAVLLIQPFLERTGRDGARAVLATEMQLQVELWRADLLSGVLEVDTQGNAVQSGFVQDQPVFSPHLLMGLPPALITGTSLAALLASSKSPSALTDALFMEGGLAVKPPASGAPTGRGGLRTGAASRRRDAGPMHTVKLKHSTDGCELELQVQAVVKQDMGTGCALYVIMHLAKPTCGRPEFAAWLKNAPAPTRPRVESLRLPEARSMSKIDTVAANVSQSAPQKQKKVVSMLSHSPQPPEVHIPGYIKPTESKAMLDTLDSLPDMSATGMKSDGLRSFDKEDKIVEISRVSEDSLSKTPFKEEGRQRITTWMSAAHEDGSMDGERDMSSSDGEQDDFKQEDDENGRAEEHVATKSEEDAAELDEAGTSMNDFKRGKRLKKLIKLLGTPQAVSDIQRFRITCLAVLGMLVLVDVAMFISFNTMVTTQIGQVLSLRLAARAGSRVMQIAQLSSSIELLIASHLPENPSMKYLGAGTTLEDVQANLKLMSDRVDDLVELHHGIFRGFGKPKSLPEAYGLRAMWDSPSLQTLEFYKYANKTGSVPKLSSVWAAGNRYTLAATSILQNVIKKYPVDTNTRFDFANDTDLLYILYNGPRSLVEAYELTLDGMMQAALDDSHAVNNIQLVVLGLEGGLVATVALLIIWIVTRKVIKQRFNVFSIFLKVPVGVIKSEATRAQNLIEGDEEEEQDEANVDDQEAGLTAPLVPALGPAPVASTGGARKSIDLVTGDTEFPANRRGAFGAGKIAPAGAWQAESGDIQRGPGFLSRSMTFLTSWRAPTNTGAVATSKRTLKPSTFGVLKVAWPFAVWAIFVVVINALGFISLSSVSDPIATSNVVQFVSIRVNKVILQAQRYVGQQYLDLENGFVSLDDRDSVTIDKYKYNYRKKLDLEYQLLLKEYQAMMYGRYAPLIINDSSPHFQLQETGIIFNKEASFLFEHSGCLSEDPSDCLTPDSDMYQYVSQGLDQAIKHLFYSIEALILLPNDEVKLSAPPFSYIYQIGTRDIVSSLEKLIDVYSTAVQNVYNEALVFHIVALVAVCTMALAFIVFILLPTCKMVANERRRIAELLSHLPSDIDVESMVTEALGTVSPLGPRTSLTGPGMSLQNQAKLGSRSMNM